MGNGGGSVGAPGRRGGVGGVLRQGSREAGLLLGGCCKEGFPAADRRDPRILRVGRALVTAAAVAAMMAFCRLGPVIGKDPAHVGPGRHRLGEIARASEIRARVKIRIRIRIRMGEKEIRVAMGRWWRRVPEVHAAEGFTTGSIAAVGDEARRSRSQ